MSIISCFPYGGNSSGGQGGGSTTGDYRVRFIDYDGTILQTSYVNSGGSVTAPSDPSHTGLTFQGWNYSSSAFSNITSDLDVGAMYITSDGKSKLNIRLTDVSGLSPTLYLVKSNSSTLTIEWGDGNTSTTTSNTSFNISHTYPAVGDYTISLSITSGSGVYGFGNLSTSSTVIGGSTQAYRNTLMSVQIGSNVTGINYCAFYYCYSLTSISIPSSVTYTEENIFYCCYSLISINIPSGVTSIKSSAFYYCYSLVSISIPSSVTSIGTGTFSLCYSLASMSIPSSVTSIGTYAFNYCCSLKSIGNLSHVTVINDDTFYCCSSLMSVNTLSRATSINCNAFYYCYSLTSVSIPSSVTRLCSNAFSGCYSLTSVSIPSSVTSIDSNVFNNCYSVLKYIFNPTTPPTLGSVNAFTGINSICKIYVSDASVSAYKAATNWSTYANYIYPMSSM